MANRILLTAGQAHEKIYLAAAFDPFPDGCAFYLRLAGARSAHVRVSRETAADVLLAMTRNGITAGHAGIVSYDPKGLLVDIGG